MKYDFQIIICIFGVFLTGAAGCAGGGAESGAAAASDDVNYPDVWERVLPKEVQTNIANYGRSSEWVEEHTNLADYAVDVEWQLDKAYHVEGEEYDDVVLRFIGHWWSRNNRSKANVFYYSFFSGKPLSKDGKNKLRLSSTIHNVMPENVSVQRLSFTSRYPEFDLDTAKRRGEDISKYLFISKVTLSNDIVYDESYIDKSGSGWSCRDPLAYIISYDFTSFNKGVHFLSAEYKEEYTSRENSWFLIQGLDKPRWITKKCQWGTGSLNPVHVYRYQEFSFLRVDDNIIPLLDGTFLFVGTEGEFPTFYIPRLKSDMSIPASMDTRYKWISYKDLFGIIKSDSCPSLKSSSPYCIKSAEDGSCSKITGSYTYYDNNSEAPEKSDDFYVHSRLGVSYCLNLALREYARGNLEIYHCQDGDEINPSTVPCNEREQTQ